jgi:hypothetical protein
MTTLKVAMHNRRNGIRIVEVYDNDGKFVAAIYPSDETNGIKIVSKHIATFDFDDGKLAVPDIPAVTVDFIRPKP